EDEKAQLGLIDRSAIVDEAPGFGSFGGGFSAPSPMARESEQPATTASEAAKSQASEATAIQPEDGPTAQVDPDQALPDRPTASATATIGRDAPETASGEALRVLATNGHTANGRGNGNGKPGGNAAPITLNLGGTKVSFQAQADAPSCAECGSIMIRNGSCYKCLNCGSTSGCS